MYLPGSHTHFPCNPYVSLTFQLHNRINSYFFQISPYGISAERKTVLHNMQTDKIFYQTLNHCFNMPDRQTNQWIHQAVILMLVSFLSCYKCLYSCFSSRMVTDVHLWTEDQQSDLPLMVISLDKASVQCFCFQNLVMLPQILFS